MKKDKLQKRFIEEIEKVPLVQVVCDRLGISRNSVYRWMKEDLEFLKQVNEAKTLGVALVNDVAESNVLSRLKSNDWQATKYWLSHRHKNYQMPLMHRDDYADILEADRRLKMLTAEAGLEQLKQSLRDQKSEEELAKGRERLTKFQAKWFKKK